MPKQKLDVIDPISTEEFYQKYFLPRKPVVIRNYFSDQPIGKLTTMPAIAEAFRDLDVDIIEEYVDRMFKKKKLGGEISKRKLSEYLQLIDEQPQTRQCVREQRTPAAVQTAFGGVPRYADIRDNTDIETNLFIANAGNVSRIHFDADHRSTMLYQVAGRKRVVLISETESKKLSPMFNFSLLFIESMSPEDREKFLDYTNAWEHMLMPGEMLCFPMMMWHQLEYTDSGMSVNFRYGRSDVGKFLYDNVHPDVFLQNLAVKFHSHDSLEGSLLEAFTAIQEQVNAKFDQPFEQYQAMRALSQSWYQRLCTDAIQADYYASYDDLLIELVEYFNECACYPYKR